MARGCDGKTISPNPRLSPDFFKIRTFPKGIAYARSITLLIQFLEIAVINIKKQQVKLQPIFISEPVPKRVGSPSGECGLVVRWQEAAMDIKKPRQKALTAYTKLSF